MAVMIAVTIGAVLIVPFQTTVTDSIGTQTVENETVPTDELDTWYDLEGYSVNSGSETVYWYNSTSGSNETLSSPNDYEIRYDTGEVLLNSSGKVSTNDDVWISYDYEASGSLVTTVAPVVVLLFILVILVALAREVENAM